MLARNRNFFIFLFILAWLMAVLVGYYAVHKPFSPEQALAIAKSLVNLWLGLWLGLLFGGLGRWLYPAPELTSLERVTVQAALGFGLFGLMWLGLGAMGLFSRLVSWTVLLLGSLWLLRPARNWAADLLIGLRDTQPRGWISRVAAGFAALAILFSLLTALAPPIQWDALVYHLDLPRRYLAAGGLVFLPDQPFWGQPQLMEMNYTFATGLLGASTAVLAEWVVGAIFILGLLGLAARLIDAEAAWVSVAAVLAGASLRSALGGGYVDLAGAFFGLALLILCLQVIEGGLFRSAELLAIGLLVGMTAGIKYTNLLVFPLLAVVVVLFFPGRRRERVRAFVVVISVGVLLFAPWLLRNALATGNPVYPYLFPTDTVTDVALSFETHTAEDTSSLLRFVSLPIELTWLGQEGGVGYSSDIGVLLLMLAVPGGFAAWKLRSGRVVLVWALLGWLAMATASQFSALLQQTRLYYLFLPAVALLAGWGWQLVASMRVGQLRMQRVAGGLLVFVLSLSLLEGLTAVVQQGAVHVLIGQQSEQEFLEHNLGGYAAAMQALHQPGAEQKTLFLWEPRGLYAPRAAVSDPWINRWYTARHTLGSENQILQSWQAAGYERLLIFRAGAEFERANRPEYQAEDWQALESLTGSLQRLPGELPGYELYRLP